MSDMNETEVIAYQARKIVLLERRLEAEETNSDYYYKKCAELEKEIDRLHGEKAAE